MVKMVRSTKVHGKMVLSLIKLSIVGANFLLMYPCPPFFQSFLPQYLPIQATNKSTLKIGKKWFDMISNIEYCGWYKVVLLFYPHTG